MYEENASIYFCMVTDYMQTYTHHLTELLPKCPEQQDQIDLIYNRLHSLESFTE